MYVAHFLLAMCSLAFLFVCPFFFHQGVDTTLGIGDSEADIVDCGTGLETTLETKWLGSGNDSGDLAVGEWRRH